MREFFSRLERKNKGVTAALGFALIFWSVSVGGEKNRDFMLAEDFYEKKQFAMAAYHYRRFTESHPNSSDIQKALFRLAESYRENGNRDRARDTYEIITKRFRRGKWVGESAFHLGMFLFDSRNYEEAAKPLMLASHQAIEEVTRSDAKFYLARALHEMGDRKAAIALFEELADSKEESRLELAKLHHEAGNLSKSRQMFDALIDGSTSQAIKEEAIFRSGLAALDSGLVNEARERFEQVSRFSRKSPWRSFAPVGFIFAASFERDHDTVLRIYSSGSVISTAGEFRPRVLIKVAEAYQAEGDTKAATRLYSLVAAKYPEDPVAIEAGYRELTLLYQSKSSIFSSKVDRFKDGLARRDPGNVHIDKSNLMLGEWHFFQAEKFSRHGKTKYAREHYHAAAAAYRDIRKENLDPKYQAIKLFHQSWAWLETGDLINGSESVNELKECFPESPLVPSAIAKRGETYLAEGDIPNALADFEWIIDQHRDCPELELALERTGRIQAHKNETEESIAAYLTLLERFPETRGKAEANFRLGVGYFDQEKYEEAIPYLNAARKIEPDLYLNKASIRIILALYSLERFTELNQACRIYLQRSMDAGVLNALQKQDRPPDIPAVVLHGLGIKMVETGQFQDGEYFLERASTPKQPALTPPEVWRALGDARIARQAYQAAIVAYDNCIKYTSNLNDRGYAYLRRGYAQLAMDQLNQSRSSVHESLRVIKQGRINAEARLLAGDIEMKQGNTESALREYRIVCELFNDRVVTPIAMQKAIAACDKLGAADKSAELKKSLQFRFPHAGQE